MQAFTDGCVHLGSKQTRLQSFLQICCFVADSSHFMKPCPLSKGVLQNTLIVSLPPNCAICGFQTHTNAQPAHTGHDH